MLEKWLVAFPPKNKNPISCVTEFRESLGGVEGEFIFLFYNN
jgi:hypothetical protein